MRTRASAILIGAGAFALATSVAPGMAQSWNPFAPRPVATVPSPQPAAKSAPVASATAKTAAKPTAAKPATAKAAPAKAAPAKPVAAAPSIAPRPKLLAQQAQPAKPPLAIAPGSGGAAGVPRAATPGP